MKHHTEGTCTDCDTPTRKSKSLGKEKPMKGGSPQAPGKKKFPEIKGTRRGKDYR